MCSLHLTHPSGVCPLTARRSGSSWGFGALLKGLTSVVDTSCQRRDSNPQPWVTSGFKSNALSIRPRLPHDCDPNVFSSSYLPAIVICRLLFTNKNVGRFFFFFFSVFKVLLLNIRKTYSDSDCWETNQHHAYNPNGQVNRLIVLTQGFQKYAV